MTEHKTKPQRLRERLIQIAEVLAAHQQGQATTQAELNTLLVDLCDTMEDGSLCAMGGMTPNPVNSVLNHFADDFITDQPSKHVETLLKASAKEQH